MINPAEAAWYANEAYKDKPNGGGLAFTTGPHQCTVWMHDNNAVVGFRGTEVSIKDLITNIKSEQVDNKAGAGKVHKGYQDAAWELFPLIKPMLDGVNNEDVTYVGHSMGGALAIQMHNIQLASCVYTFNAPKSGDEEFANHIAQYEDIFRFVSKRDWAQSYPSDTKEWAHVGHKIQLESTGHSMENILKVL